MYHHFIQAVLYPGIRHCSVSYLVQGIRRFTELTTAASKQGMPKIHIDELLVTWVY